eukprot:CAMPEP_0119405626 /NCGR_PEP_ID=MMETSP1335-20130426/225_1 /TAXON_ID=259385 /ORGANISM="Chrysoculter rhomboideus, Strain RCC1486" /LENGTH=78 /DNA_ID=CAMNT_0007429645 /DNA_START=472 /DNA_END=708 /DNA_ORIENTATION=-
MSMSSRRLAPARKSRTYSILQRASSSPSSDSKAQASGRRAGGISARLRDGDRMVLPLWGNVPSVRHGAARSRCQDHSA